MSRIRQPHNDALRDALASQYILGTLDGAARARFEKMMDSDPELRIRVQEWSHRLAPMANGLTPVEPPAKVWKQIQARTHKRRPGLLLKLRFWENLNFWRRLSMATASLLVAVSVLWIVPSQQVAQKDSMMVVVNNRFDQPVWVIETSASDKMMMIKTLRDIDMGPDKTCALWLTWDDGMTMSLGQLPEKSGMMEMEKPPMPGRTLDKARVVVSLEPMNNYDKKTIKGPLLFSDKFVTI
ncbi:MAG: anti-sigma factor [Gammaproteobacteria bacterium]|nr:anti-sigma factor [Gammaproteobacteria bacterium]